MSPFSDFSSLDQQLQVLDPFKVIFLTDSNTHALCLPQLISELPSLKGYEILEVEPGEESKCLEVAANLWLSLAEMGVERTDLMINVGGGVVTDLGGFVASTFKRGIPFIHIPTSLLAMVDAAHGGKTGIDLGSAKNLIGTFQEPDHLLIYPGFLKSLPGEHLKSGFAEMLKHGLIDDEEHWNDLAGTYPDLTGSLIQKSFAIKNSIVEKDRKENGQRKLLNFGHTIGHALESFLLEKGKPVLHGEAVAAGMITESKLSLKHARLSKEEAIKITQKLDDIFDRLEFGEEDIDSILAWLKHDKKNKRGKCSFTLLDGIGHGVYNKQVGLEDVRTVLKQYLHRT